jgi:fibronectin type 3 domain-containing protein/regulation of enolase protein 1 (concanavalin A-like superfamily)
LKNAKRGLVQRNRQIVRASIEGLENRQLLSATLSLSGAQLVFNAVQNSSASPTETLTLTDTGSSPLTLGSSAFTLANDPSVATKDSARFTLLNATSAPATLSPGQSFTLDLDYKAIAVGINSAFLDITTNDSANPTHAVSLRGIGTKGLGGTNQPSLATILQAYDIPTLVGEGPDDANAATDATYPNPPDPSSQEVVLQRMVKAGAGPVTIDVLASFTASGFAKSYVLGTYTPGDPTSLNQLFYTTATENQTTYVQPQGATTFDPGSSAFGFYFISNEQVAGRVGYSEDALNTWDTTNSRKFRFFPMETPSGTVVPNTYIMTSTEWNSPAGYDFTNIVAIVSNIKAAPSAPTAPVIGLENEDAVAGSSTMVFNRIGTQNPTVGDQVHNTNKLLVTNTGQQPLIISSYSLTSQWSLVSPPTFPLTIPAGASQTLTIQFNATSVPSVPYNETNDVYYPKGGGVYTGTLVLHSNDPNNSTSTVPLAGYDQTESENSQEPSLQTITNLLYGWDTNINATPIPGLTETSTTNSTPTYYGEEVVSPYWMAADPGASVTVEQIAAFHTEGNTVPTYWYTEGSGTYNKLFTTAATDGQTLLPYETGTTNLSVASFSTNSAFGFKIDYDYSDDAKNTGTFGGGHHVRFYPVRTSNGTLVPNTYLMAMDYSVSPENYDFQDNLYLVTNIRPAVTVTGITTAQTTAAPAAPTDFYAAGTASGIALEWAPVQDSALTGYDVYRSSSLTGTYALLNSTPLTTTSYTDTATTSGSTYFYKVTAYDSSIGAQSLASSSQATALSSSSKSAPAAPTNLTATGVAGGVTLSWYAVNDPTLAGYDLYSSSSASGPFILLTSSPISATVYTDSTAAIGRVTYYQVTAVDASSGLSSSAASTSGTALAITGLQSVDVGATPTGSTTIVTPGTDFNVTAGGPGVANTVDGFRYIYQTQTGNFDVKVQVLSLTVAGNYSTAGILARDSLDTSSPDVYMSASPVNYRFKERSTEGGVNNIVVGPATTFPNVWVRLTRVGNVFTGYYSNNGTTWTQLSSITLALPTTLDLGLAVASNDTTQTTTAQLRSYGNTAVTAPTPPATPANFTATGTTDAVTLAWSAVADATLKGYNVYRNSTSGGTYTLLTSNPITATSYTDTSATPGLTYYYEVTAVDASSGLSSVPATANAAATAPITGLQSIDIGATPSGSTTVVTPNTDYNVTAGGPGIAANEDGFRYVYQSQTGNFDVKVQVLSITVAGNYSTAGILARSTLTTTSPDVYMSASPINYRFKERSTVGGVNNIVVGPATSFPDAWVRLTRVGNLFTGYYSTDGINWTELSSITLALPTTLDLGLAVASNDTTQTTTAVLRGYGNTIVAVPPAAPTHLTAVGTTGGITLNWSAVADTTLRGYNVYSSNFATGTYNLLTASPIAATTFTDTSAPAGVTTYYRVTAVDGASGLESTTASASATALFSNALTSVDIGASPTGTTTFNSNNGAYTVVAGGPGVTGTTDGFRYLYTTETGNFDVKVQVASLTVAGNYSTAGIMARSTLDAGSPDVYMSASPVNYRFKYRTTEDATTTIPTAGTTSYPDVWVRLQRIGNVFNGYYSTNGTTWTLMSSVTVVLGNTIDLGLAVASNVSTETTTATLENYGNT